VKGRWPSNLILDGSPEVVGCFPDAKGAVSNGSKTQDGLCGTGTFKIHAREQRPGYADRGSAARYFATCEQLDDWGGTLEGSSKVDILQGDVIDVLTEMEPESMTACLCDPPYGLEFMGKKWDHGVPGVPYWEAVWRVLAPGAVLMAFGGTRTVHRLTCAIEDAGFEIFDVAMWVYGSGFPKSHNISKAIDKRGGYPQLAKEIGKALTNERILQGMSVTECDRIFCDGTTNWSWFEGRPAGQRAPTPSTFARIVATWPSLSALAEKVDQAERAVVEKNPNARNGGGVVQVIQKSYERDNITAPATPLAATWDGWGTALKPAYEPIIMARKPRQTTYAQTAVEHGSGALNIDDSRVPTLDTYTINTWDDGSKPFGGGAGHPYTGKTEARGRWPANLILDGSDEVVGCFPETGKATYRGPSARRRNNGLGLGTEDERDGKSNAPDNYGDSGSSARYFQHCPQDGIEWVPDGTYIGLCENHDEGGLWSGVARDATTCPVCGEKLVAIEEQYWFRRKQSEQGDELGRWPANLIHDGSDEVVGCFPERPGGNYPKGGKRSNDSDNVYGTFGGNEQPARAMADSGSAARFFKRIAYHAKASRRERDAGLGGWEASLTTANDKWAVKDRRNSTARNPTEWKQGPRRNPHPTVKPLALTKYLATLLRPPDAYLDEATLLVPFCGVFSEGIGAILAGWRNVVGIELDPEYVEMGEARAVWWAEAMKTTGLTDPKEILKAMKKRKPAPLLAMIE